MLRKIQILAAAVALSGTLPIVMLQSTSLQAIAHVGEDDDFAAGEPGDSATPSRTVEVTMSEGNGTMTYAPAEIDVRTGEQIRFIVKNVGTLKHEFFLDSFKHNASHKVEMQKNPEMEHDDPNAQSIEPGQQKEILWRFSKPGTFEFACLIPGHYEAGMHGKVVVK
jgi:uncharacterized cupredoxin-like copper-binding protein